MQGNRLIFVFTFNIYMYIGIKYLYLLLNIFRQNYLKVVTLLTVSFKSKYQYFDLNTNEQCNFNWQFVDTSTAVTSLK